jgi:hypothetical protein
MTSAPDLQQRVLRHLAGLDHAVWIRGADLIEQGFDAKHVGYALKALTKKGLLERATMPGFGLTRSEFRITTQGRRTLDNDRLSAR